MSSHFSLYREHFSGTIDGVPARGVLKSRGQKTASPMQAARR
jgi:hypothetical protein